MTNTTACWCDAALTVVGNYPLYIRNVDEHRFTALRIYTVLSGENVVANYLCTGREVGLQAARGLRATVVAAGNGLDVQRAPTDSCT